ncbi:Calcium channel YVC1 [Colletotrichum fructicola]|uniref:Nonselective cation channel n=2 Tax=Colletotrichum gloeosporioides species complex TaxID=2707338 RepID=L2G8B2_COLFN|nr:Calcium channel YVC1 [Colletotrichum fructicola]KAF4885295.1 Calcium channel YVC1 [Colletotrichum fructicola]KAF4887416.1 Calcium channel YVC1 [Colletotrichum fructicola]KAF4924854.1 Calcium channel YVC1 [Colletotrichum fructicola]
MSDRGRRTRLQLPEERPLLQRNRPSHASQFQVPLYGCMTNPHNHLPVYTNIHRIRRDIISIVEDYLSLEQLRDVRINIAVVRPLVDKLYELDDISIVYCLLVNRAQFLHEQSHLNSRQNVNYSRATLCELVATRILRRFSEDNDGPEGLVLLSHILVAGFEPFQNAPAGIREAASTETYRSYNRMLPSLEIAILTESKHFLSATPCQKVVDAIYEGRIVYTPSSFMDIIPDHYKLKPISLYNPREGPLLDQYRLLVPRTRNILEVFQFMVLLALYLSVMAERNPEHFTLLEGCFAVFAFGWSLDQFATILEHGWHVYTQNLWSFLDVGFIGLYAIYAVLRIHGGRTGELVPKQQALDVLAMGAPVLVPRLAFNLLSDNLVFLSLRSMMSDFVLLTFLSAWCFGGFLLSLLWLGEGPPGEGEHAPVLIGKWMLWIWFGLDGTGISRSADFHPLLGPVLMVAFAFLGNTLFLTILVSMLSNTFSTIVKNATAEIQFRKAVLTLEGVKGDAIFAYQPPFNILAVFLLLPLKFVLGPRWFHKIHVASVRLVNLPLLLIIAVAERRILWPPPPPEKTKGGGALTLYPRVKQWFWEKWRITAHRDIRAVFDLPPPDSVEEEIAVDDDFTHHMIRRQFTRTITNDTMRKKSPLRRDSMFPGVSSKLRGSFTGSEDMHDVNSRLEALEQTTSRIESLLTRMVGSDDYSDKNFGTGESSTLRDMDASLTQSPQQRTYARRMCEVFIYKHVECKCIWGEIAVSCGPGMGYTTCGQFGSGIAKKPLRMQLANLRPCPKHDLLGLYDRNQIRMIKKITNGIKFGTGPNKQDAGIECACAIM